MKTYEQRAASIEQTVAREKKRRHVRTISIVSCVCAFLIAFNLVLFAPYTVGGAPSLKTYETSDYYPVMQRLSDLVYSPARKTNNFKEWGLDELFENVKGGIMDDGIDFSPSAGAPSNESGSYREVTNNQVEGVIEGDLFKRSEDTLFYLGYRVNESLKYYDLQLRAYSIAGADSALISELTIPNDLSLTVGGGVQKEMYLAEDCRTAILLVPCYKNSTRYTAIITVDTENPASMSVKEVQLLSGNYVSSRMQNGVLLLVNNFSVYSYNVDFSDETTYLPQYGTADDLKSLPAQDIYLPENATRANYTVLATFNTASGELIDAEALLSFSDEVYVSQDNIYTTNEYTVIDELAYLSAYDGSRVTHAYTKSVTEITRIAYAGGMLEVAASQTVDGTVNDRYSMDEYNGQFRVFTTAPSVPSSDENGLWAGYNGTSANLYVMNCDTMEIIAEALRFCPAYESVQSARFDGNTAYVCTALVFEIMACDPVYIFDLSDLANINSKDTGEIAGFSSSLVTFKDGTLLGIGYADGRWSGWMKIEVYGETQDGVESIATYELACDFAEDFKAYYINKDEGLVGLAVYAYDYAFEYEPNYTQYRSALLYLLLRFDGYELIEEEVVELDVRFYNGYTYYDGYACAETRAFLADGWFYIVNNSDLTAEYIG